MCGNHTSPSEKKVLTSARGGFNATVNGRKATISKPCSPEMLLFRTPTAPVSDPHVAVAISIPQVPGKFQNTNLKHHRFEIRDLEFSTFLEIDSLEHQPG
jgi:hypothetical protein